MGLFDFLRGPAEVEVTAHILDPVSGYSTQVCRVGRDIDSETVRNLAVAGNIYVIVNRENGRAKNWTVLRKDAWDAVRKSFDGLDASARSYGDIDKWLREP
jgi:hypothetical protein